MIGEFRDSVLLTQNDITMCEHGNKPLDFLITLATVSFCVP